MAYGFSPVVPLIKSEEDGFYALTKTIAENTKQNLKNLLLTSPGERVMEPTFGVGLRNFLFRNRYETLEADITQKIEKQVAMFLPYITILNIAYERHEPQYDNTDKENLLDVRIFYEVSKFKFSDMLEITKVQFL